MKILILNCGSSSIKYKMFDMDTKELIGQGGIEKIGSQDSFLKMKSAKTGENVVICRTIIEHTAGIELIMNALVSKEHGCIKSLDEIDAVGHRVVHGAEKFNQSVRIDKEVKEMITKCVDIAPLHNPANLKGIAAIEAILPDVPQVAVFDTAFHQTMPDYAYIYPLPYSLYEKYGVRRYGFHGTSHRFVSSRACEFLGIPLNASKIISCHIGNGGSITAIQDGKSIDTSMGFTPVEGLMMGTRCGDVDAGVLSFVMSKENLNSTTISNMINTKSGLLGVSGISNDMREIQKAVQRGNKRAVLAENMYFYRIRKYIGAYAAALGGVDVIVFTGGVGENQFNARQASCEGLEFMGVQIDIEKNKTVRGEEAVISTPESKVKVVVIPTDEEWMIALDTVRVLS